MSSKEETGFDELSVTFISWFFWEYTLIFQIDPLHYIPSFFPFKHNYLTRVCLPHNVFYFQILILNNQ